MDSPPPNPAALDPVATSDSDSSGTAPPDRGSPDPQRIEHAETSRKFSTLSPFRSAAAGDSRAPGALNSQLPQIPDFELLHRIGSGSYGDVWLARDVLGQLRAVKVIYRLRFSDPRPFEREFEGIQRFEPISRSHPSQLHILHVGKNDAAGCFYYIMELADSVSSFEFAVSSSQPPATGQQPETQNSKLETYLPHTLRHDLERHTRLPIPDCVQIGLSLATALVHLHEQGLVHRDIKPSNIIFVNGVAKLGDIGLVTEAGDTQSIVGTEGYLPPEGPGTPQADLFSLGKVLYEMSTGMDRRRFAELPDDLRSWEDRTAVVEFNEIVLKACAKDLRRRYATAEEVQTDLLHLQRGQSVIHKHARQRHLTFAVKASLGIAAVAVVLAGVWFLSSRFNSFHSNLPAAASTELNSLAVLPVVNEGKYGPHEYLSDALTEETINALTNCIGLRVTPRSVVFAFKKATNDLRQIGQQLGVRTVLAGSMNRQGSTNLHLAARLISVADGVELWSASYDRHSTNMGAIQREVAQAVAQALGCQLSDEVCGRLESNLVRKLEAYRLHREALKHLNPATKRDFTEVVNLYSQALELDPQYATAYLGLGDAYIMASDSYLPPKSAMPTAKGYLLRALEIDDSLAVVHSFLAIVKMRYDHDWAGARQQLQRALELDRAASLWAWLIYLWSMGPLDEAEAVAREDLQREPARPFRIYNLGFVLLLQRRYDEALEKARWLVHQDTNSLNGYWLELEVQIWKGKHAEALALADKILAIDEEPNCLSAQGYIYARMGRREEALKTIAALDRLAHTRFVPKGCWALIYNGLDDKQRALDYLEQADQERSEALSYARWTPLWDSYRAEPRFIALLKKAGLEK